MDGNKNAARKQEQRLADQLKNMCFENGKEKNPTKSAKILHKLGLIYQRQSPDKVSLIKSCALLNSAIIRNPNNVDEIKQDLQKFCSHVLRVAEANNKDADLVLQSQHFAENIKLMRDQINSELNKIKQIPNDIDNDKLHRLQQIKIQSMQKIQGQITQKYKNIMKTLNDYCENVMGEPPCEYALVGMGSMARNEITPYSDFENIIVLEEGCQTLSNYKEILEYFRWFAVIFQIILINLGETILPCVSIQSLNDYATKGGNWFFDTSTRGISLDGMIPYACKCPLGRQQMTDDKPWKTELIKPVSLMLKYLESEESLKQGYHLSDILTKTCFVSGNNSTFQQFNSGVQRRLRQQNKENKLETLKEQVLDDLSSFGTKQSLGYLDDSETFNMKRVVYRSTTLFISALASLHYIDASSCFDIITELHDKQVISSFAKHKLMYGVALACEIRLRVYMKKKSQDDCVQPKSTDVNPNHELVDLVGEDSIFSYFRIAYALQYITCEQLGINKVNFYTNASLLNISISCFLGNKEKINKYIQQYFNSSHLTTNNCSFENIIQHLETLCEQESTSSLNESNEDALLSSQKHEDSALCDNLLTIGDYLLMMKQYTEAHEYISKALQQMERLQNDHYSNQQKANIFFKLAHCEKDIIKKKQHSEKALKLFNKDKDGEERERKLGECLCLDNIGSCLNGMSKYVEAIEYFNKALEIKREISKDETTDKNVATTLSNIGDCLLCMFKYAEALYYFKKAMEIDQKASMDETTDKSLAATLNNVGLCLMDMHQYTEAMKSFKKALKIKQNVSLDETTDEDVALTLNNIGFCLMKVSKNSEAMNYFVRTLKIRQRISPDENRDKNISTSFNSIGDCLMELFKPDQAVKYFERALKIDRKISADKTLDHDMATTLNNLGNCSRELGRYCKALAHLNEALKIDQKLSVDETKDKDVAATFNNVGKCFVGMLRYTEAINYFTKALKIFQKISTDPSVDKDIATALQNISECLMNSFKHCEAMHLFNEALKIRKQSQLMKRKIQWSFH